MGPEILTNHSDTAAGGRQFVFIIVDRIRHCGRELYRPFVDRRDVGLLAGIRIRKGRPGATGQRREDRRTRDQ
ncbi:hypothetical protein [Mycobacterium intracellulare]|uniref:hypothetical protein n=1 Tax=Mycobacterium intracellulare TaxID=1767 RepID=UPI0018E08BE6|nr:hypothetical protein [Mycobacterium intracellulare]